MNKTVKKAWVRALRSDEYEQGRSGLHDPAANTFCCLGVLCDLHAKKTGREWGCHGSMGVYVDTCCLPPDVVREWSGLSDAQAKSLAGFNDRGFTFKQLANIIEGYDS
jgi:hypothetical protein